MLCKTKFESENKNSQYRNQDMIIESIHKRAYNDEKIRDLLNSNSSDLEKDSLWNEYRVHWDRLCEEFAVELEKEGLHNSAKECRKLKS